MIAMPCERQQAIRERLDRQGRVLAADLALEFKTSEDTIRRDLRELAAAGECRRVYGGALTLSPKPNALSERNVQEPARKHALGVAAAALVRPGDILLLDAGSTNLQIARALPPDLRCTIITNAPSIADALAAMSACDVIMIGGRVDLRVGGCIGAKAMRDLQGFRVDLCFLGACAMSLATGITSFDAEEAEFKRAMIERSQRTVVALTNDKLATLAPFGVAPLSEIDDIVIESDAPPARLEGLDGTGCRLHHAGRVRL